MRDLITTVAFVLLWLVCVYAASEWDLGVKKLMGRITRKFKQLTSRKLENSPVEEKIHGLCCLLIKLDYMQNVCCNPAVSNETYINLSKELCDLEEAYPQYAKPYKPNGTIVGLENNAKLAFGSDWDELRRTWDLLKKEQVVYGD